jgi:hypothetical protein
MEDGYGIAVFDVERVWKGSFASQRVVQFPLSPVTFCGFNPQPGARYLVYAMAGGADVLSTHGCERSLRITEWQARQDLEVLGAGTPVLFTTSRMEHIASIFQPPW